MPKFKFLVVAMLTFIIIGQIYSAEITLIYDESNNLNLHKEMYYSGNWDMNTGIYKDNWNDFTRYRMFDDGKHNDKNADDDIWGIVVDIEQGQGVTFEWACDKDSNKDNGWLGNGLKFTVENNKSKTVYFKPPSKTGDGNSMIDIGRLSGSSQESSDIIIDIEHGAPTVINGKVLFTFTAPDADAVYIAGTFNNWAHNDGGKVTDYNFAMKEGPDNIWYKLMDLKPITYKFKYVVEKNGNYNWLPDPFIDDKDGDGNSIIDLSDILTFKTQKKKIIEGRPLKPLIITPFQKNKDNIFIDDIYLHKIWIQPSEKTKITIKLKNIKSDLDDYMLNVYIKNVEQKVLSFFVIDDLKEENTFTFDSNGYDEGGYIVDAVLMKDDKIIDNDKEVVSVVKDISDDLRYGFYANWCNLSSDYFKKTDMLAKLHINAIEYYDYFPAHGYYAPKEKKYKYEPFGIDILGEDVQKKIDSSKERNILSIAYVAAYASSLSVYKKYPYPMTNVDGIPYVFFHYVMTEKEAKEQNKDIWFYLMAIARDSKWNPYIMSEFKRCLDNSKNDIVEFDGFEIDSYGHPTGTKYYSKGSKYNGQLLSKVIRMLVEDTFKLTHSMKKKAAVSFNCVNEFGIEKMYDVTDFLFIENWAGYKSFYDDLIEICYDHRKHRNQRVILKVYPADTKLGQKYWSLENLKLTLGAAMTGAGSLMIAGEPDEKTGEMHALNSLYYPDNVAIPKENHQILKDYYMFDALLYRITHGRNVNNLSSDFQVPGCIIRCYDSDEKYIVVQILHNGKNWHWSERAKLEKPYENYEIAIKMSDNIKPVKVLYGTPDYKELLIPQELDWEYKEGYVRTLIPKLDVYGTLLIKYEK